VYAAGRGGRRVIAVGTTSARTLESFAGAFEAEGKVPESLTTRILITPGYRWRWVDGMLTNFHLPRSTLMAMVASRLGEGGLERLKGLYAEALDRGYRFYSYGDAMLIA
jgi:S-adenosylmethionine:tRNA ribosyltransferase-isomerase